MYDGVFEVLQWLLFLSAVPSCSATDGVVRNGKSTAGHQRYLCSHCRKNMATAVHLHRFSTRYAPENH
ncbi:IS1 family transposase [Escherichia coli]|uniref:IS1 family transposase n=1 Tax=Escherichia coli TaxID=562 RepID=UPI003D805F77